LNRSFKDEAGAWKNSDSHSGADLLLLAKVADFAHFKMEELRKANDHADEARRYLGRV
jgi:hypothetical protein